MKSFLFINFLLFSFSLSCSHFYLGSLKDLMGVREIPPYYTFPLSCPLKRLKKLSQNFRPAYNIKHEGIDLKIKANTPVYASHSGHVIHAGSSHKGYGKMILLEHTPYWATLYAHLNHLLVKKNQKISQGQKIALSGNTGRSSAPHLHFEVLHNKQPLNPLFVLPETCF